MSFTGSGANERVVLAVLRERAVVRRAELIALTGLPKATLNGVVARLLRRGLVIEQPETDPPPRRGHGRPATGLTLAVPGGAVGVIALSHVKLRVGIVGFDGQVRARREVDLDAGLTEQDVLDCAVRLLGESRAAVTGPDDTAIDCAVVAIPAPFHRGVGAATLPPPEELRAVMPDAPPVFGWFRRDPIPALAAELSVPVSADNDANLGALGEAMFGAGRGLDSFVYLKVAEGLGAGLFLNGGLYRGARGLAGELAHVQVLDDGPWCRCGGRGCLAHAFGGFLAPFVASSFGKPLGFADLLNFTRHGEAGTFRIVADAGRRVGRVLADLCTVLSPEAVIVDGMLGAATAPFITGLREMIDRHMPAATVAAVQTVGGELGDRAELLGAVALARQEHLEMRARQ